jgi:very-short-patch-repair endonuclease
MIINIIINIFKDGVLLAHTQMPSLLTFTWNSSELNARFVKNYVATNLFCKAMIKEREAIGVAKFIVQFRRDRDYLIWIGMYLKQLFQTKRFPDWQRIKCSRSPIQIRLYDALKREGYRVKAEYETCGYQVDLVIKKYRLAIECDGAAFHSSPEQKKRDRKKTAVLSKHGWKVMRFKGWQINKQVEKCVERINEYTGIHRKRWWQIW